MSIVQMVSETCYHSAAHYGYDDKGNHKVPPCQMVDSAEDKSLTCPTCGAVDRDVVKVSDYPGHEENRISHGANCPHHNKLDTSGKFSTECTLDTPGEYVRDRCYGPFGCLYMQTTHVGVVLEDRERSGRDDSDFYAVVWNADKGCTEQVEYATTRGWTYPNHCRVDATPEVIAAYQAWSEQKRAEYRKLEADRVAKQVAKGKMVKVVRGRKVAKGTTGQVFWLGMGEWGSRVGIKDSAGTVHWTAEKNCEVILPTQEE